MTPRTVVQILSNDLEVVSEVKSFYPINQHGMILRYSKELSDWGKCTFRIATSDPILSQYGDILIPHQYHIRIKRENKVVWAGGIISNPTRNKLYVEVTGAEYDFYLNKIFIRRDASETAGDGKENYKLFNSGTMSSAVTTIINNAVSDFNSTSPMKSLTVGTIENPNFPDGFTDADGDALTGAWTFSDYVALQFDYMSAYYVLKSFGVYANSDFEITPDMEFNFKKFIGNKQTDLVFRYGTQGNIVDYNLPRRGEDMVNDLWGVAADNDGVVLHTEQSDSVSVKTYGKLESAQAFSDVKNKSFLKSRTNATLNLLKNPDVSAVNVVLDENGYPLGQYDIGDIVTVQIKDHVIDFSEPMRVVGITVNLHNTGREMTTVQTNRPDPNDIGA